MTPQQYRKIYDWFTARPRALRALGLADRLLAAVCALSYPVLLGWLGLRAGQSPSPAAWALLARAVAVPAAVFLGGSALRRWLNFPRPYQQPGFVPLSDKTTQGRAFPSRHALSAAVLAAVWLRVAPPVGWFLTLVAAGVCLARVLTGVHAPRDVLCGAALGFGLGWLGMSL